MHVGLPQSEPATEDRMLSSMSQWSTLTISATYDGMLHLRTAALPRITWSSDTYVEYDCSTTALFTYYVCIIAAWGRHFGHGWEFDYLSIAYQLCIDYR